MRKSRNFSPQKEDTFGKQPEHKESIGTIDYHNLQAVL
jgi:hypothetical protein